MCGRRGTRLAVLLGVGVLAVTLASPAESAPLVVVARIEDEAITPVTVRYLRRAMNEAELARAECFVLQLDTPGGLVDSTRLIVKDFLDSPTPVVVYVTPSGARAASAGVYMTLASHVAAMTPGTHIGAAHPVQLGGLPTSPPSMPSPATPSEDQDQTESKPVAPASVSEEKLVKDAEAWARSLAERRGRNVEWAALAVTENSSLTAKEAVEQNVVELVATDMTNLLELLDGRVVDLDGHSVVLDTAGAEIRTIDMWWGERVLEVLSNPNVAFLLLMFGFYGIVFEFYTPGWGVAGTLGAICLVLAFFGLAVLPVNYAGLAFIALALGLFVAEAFVTSFGALTVGGIVCLVLGGLMLVDTPIGFLRVSLGVIVPVAVATGLIVVFLASRVVTAYRQPVRTGREGLRGMEAIVQETFAAVNGHYRCTVFVHGELWQARSSAPVERGQTVTVSEQRGLTLIVESGVGPADRPSIALAARTGSEQ